MKSIFRALVAVVFAIGMASVAASAAGSDKVEACLAMIQDHVGVEPSPKVAKLCEEGKPKQAMRAAMSGE